MSNEVDPQLENGFTRIANELFEAILAFGFSQRQILVLLTVIRKTYGYGKKEDDLSASQIGHLCGIRRNHVTEVIGQLASLNVITKRSGKYGSIIAINKFYGTWGEKRAPACPKLGLVLNKDSPKSRLSVVVPIRDGSDPDPGHSDRTELGHTKENLQKENQQKKSPRQDIRFADWLTQCKQDRRQPIPEEDPIFDYAKNVGLPIEFIRFAWIEFKRKYSESNKKYKNWNQHFGNAVRENWYGVWFEKDDQWQLTTRGKQIQKEQKGKA